MTRIFDVPVILYGDPIDDLEAVPKQYVDAMIAAAVAAAIAAATPVGSIQLWSVAIAPSGWALCDGSSAVPYPTLNSLYIANGFPYGGSGGAALLPDFRRRQVRGMDPALPAGALMGLGGNEGVSDPTLRQVLHTHGINGNTHSHVGTGGTATLATNNAGTNHTHGIVSATGHVHDAGTLAAAVATNTTVTGAGNRAQNPITGNTGTQGSHDHSGTTQLDGVHAHNVIGKTDDTTHDHGSATGNNVTADIPFLTVPFIVKT